MSEKLKCCPFCGGEAETIENNHYTDIWSVMCKNCYTESDRYNTENKAIEAWNTRKPMENVKKQIEVRKMIHSEKNECDAELDSYVSCAFDEAIEIVEKGEK